MAPGVLRIVKAGRRYRVEKWLTGKDPYWCLLYLTFTLWGARRRVQHIRDREVGYSDTVVESYEVKESPRQRWEDCPAPRMFTP